MTRPHPAAVLRPPRTDAENLRRLQKLSRWREQLQQEQAGLARWMSRLRRAFHAVEKAQQKVSRLEREIAKFEQN